MTNNSMQGNVKQPLPVDQVEQAAALWLLRRESPQWSAAEEAELAQWLKASPSHRVSFMRLGSVWREAGRLKAVSAGFAPGKVPPVGAIAHSAFFSRKRGVKPVGAAPAGGFNVAKRYKYAGVAAAACLIAVIGAALYFTAPEGLLYRTPVGGLATVPMEDGSKVNLNTDSEIEVKLDDKQRRVNLTRGEAYFEVAKDAARPFIVYADHKRIIAVGTKFSVRLKDDAVQVMVTEGQVRVERDALLWKREPLADLAPGNIASAQRSKILVQEKTLSDIEQGLSWREGYITLRKMSLGEAVREFNRYNRRQLIVDDPVLARIRVGGNFQANNLDGFVRLLHEGFQIQAEERGNKIVLTRGPSAD